MDTHQISDTLSENIDDIKDTVSHGSGKIVAIMLLIYLTVVLCFSWYWSREPDLFDIRVMRTESAQTVGLTTIQTLQDMTSLLLNKNGGYISNDVLPPGVWMDNMPNWEFGVLTQLRDFTKALKQRIGRSPGHWREDNDLIVAESRLLFDNRSWMVPSSETQYEEGIEHLKFYQNRLQSDGDDKAVFLASAENLAYWLAEVDLRLNSLSQRLSASVGPRRFEHDGVTNAVTQTPRLSVDDVFYEARGTTWALIHLLKAVQVDFADVLKQKNATERLQQIIVELEETQQPVRSPIILNGSGFGVLSNHSLVMASYIARSRTELVDLRNILAAPPVSSAP
jgi:hypothetical protein